MNTHRFFVEKLRFHLSERDTLVFVGWFYDGSTKDHALMACLDGIELPVQIQINRGAEVRQKYIRSINEINEEVVGMIKMPKDWRLKHKLQIFSFWQNETKPDYSIRVKKLCRQETEICYYIENCHRSAGKVTVSGWCMGDGETKLVLLGSKKQPLQAKTEHYYRKDLAAVFPECDKMAKPGFLVQAESVDERESAFYLEMRSANRFSRTRLKKWDDGTRWQYIVEKAGDTVRYLERNGISATVRKVHSKLRKKETTSYEQWRKKYEVTEEELVQQKQEAKQFAIRPLFSVIVPVYKTNPQYLREMIESVQRQTYPDWELCIADGSLDAKQEHGIKTRAEGTPVSELKEDTPETELTEILSKYREEDSRIKFVTLPENAGISGNTNAALSMAEGDYIVLVDHDDIVSPDALFEFAKVINEEQMADVIYSDEDKISMDGKNYFEPHFKPDFNIDLLCSMNYICHLFAVRRETAERAGSFDSTYDGAQDYDFILRCCEQAKRVSHVDKILYHWRCHMDSTAANPQSKLYAFEAGKNAIQAHYNRLSIPAKVENADFYGMYRTRYEWQETPLVSIIIPNKDHAEDLKKCIDSILTKSDYKNLEFIIVENNSTEQATFDYYRKLEEEHANIHIVYYEGRFNYSKINNFGVAASAGEYLLLLNNDTEMIDGSGIWELLGCCMRKDVGAVGAKLIYGDETIQHAGVIIGFGGTAGHAFIGKSRYDTGYFGRIQCVQDYSAVTAACLMTKKSTYEQAGGMTEELEVAFNDVDFCLKVRETGKLVIYNPYAEFYHYESKSRGYEDSPDKVERFQNEVELLVNRWRSVIEGGDPYYNRNLTLDNSDFSLRR